MGRILLRGAVQWERGNARPACGEGRGCVACPGSSLVGTRVRFARPFQSSRSARAQGVDVAAIDETLPAGDLSQSVSTRVIHRAAPPQGE
jgi:hypothetical protein